MNEFWTTITALGTALVTVAIVAVIVSKNANTSSVIQAAASGFNNGLAVATSPVTGSSTAPVLSYPSSSSSLTDELGEFG